MPSPEEMWGSFAAGGPGVRLTLRVTLQAERAHLKQIRYFEPGLQGSISHQLRRAATDHLKRTFVPWGVSRFSAFGLPLDFDSERETRLLIKRHKLPNGFDGPQPSFPATLRDRNQFEYLPISLEGKSEYVRIELRRVEASDSDTAQKADSSLANSVYASLAPVTVVSI